MYLVAGGFKEEVGSHGFSPKNCLAVFFIQVDEHVFSGVETICFAKVARTV